MAKEQAGSSNAKSDSVSLSTPSQEAPPSTPPPKKLASTQQKVAQQIAGTAIGGPSGTICAHLAKELDPMDPDSWDKAEAYYERVRECPHDTESIAHHTPYNLKQVETIKNHLFINTHQLDDGVARFDADPLIANAWHRLANGEHKEADLQLMEHELFEARFEALFDTDYRTAHEAANRSGRPSGLY